MRAREIRGRIPCVRAPLPILALVLAALALPAAAGAEAVGLVVREDGSRAQVRVEGPLGVLTSDATRLDGLVTAEDVATATYRIVPAADPAATVRELERRIAWNDRQRLPLTILIAVVVLALAAVRPPWALRAVLVALAANLWLEPAAAAAGAIAVLALPLGWAAAALLAVYLAALGLVPEVVALSPLGPSQVNRFYGVNNLLSTLLLVPALLAPALLGRVGIGVAALALVAVGGNRFGADGGGLLVLLVAYGVLWLRLTGRRPTARLLAAGAAAVVAIGLALVALDAATGADTHVTRAVGGGPVSLVGDLGDRLELSASRAAGSAGAIAVVAGGLVVLLAVLLRTPPAPVRDAFLAAIAVSLLVNDTPTDVVGMGAALAFALARAGPLLEPRADLVLRPVFDPFVTSHRRRGR